MAIRDIFEFLGWTYTDGGKAHLKIEYSTNPTIMMPVFHTKGELVIIQIII